MRALNVLLSVLVSLTIAFFLFEGGLRLLPQFRPQESINQFDSKLGWRKTPGKVAKRVTPELEVTFRINEFGLRDDPLRSLAKPEGVFRIEMLGDSFVLGFTVDRENLFVDQLEHWWNAEGRNVDVLNAGTEGWSTDQEALWFLEHGVDFEPDLVCIFPYENDIYWAGQTDYYGKAKPRFAPDGTLETGTLADTSPPRPPLQDWAIGNFLTKTLLPLLPRKSDCGPHEFELRPGRCVAREFGPLLTPAPSFVGDCVPHLRGALVALRDRCGELGIPLLMVPIPSESCIHPDRREAFLRLAGLEGLSDEQWSPDAPVDLFLGLGEELGIRTYDARPALRRRAQEIGRPLYFDQEWHFNPEGNHAFALALHNALDDLGVFPPEHAARRAVSLAVPDRGSSLPRWPFVFLALWLGLGSAYAWTYRDEKPPRVFLEVGALLAVVFGLFLGVGRLVESLPPRYAAWVLPGLVLALVAVIGWKLGRRIGTILELLKAFTLRGHWYLMPLVVVLLTIGSLLVVAASSPLIAPFIYTLF